ncbi:hypothetical protein IFM89_005490 [Coptis chinensis]|uniref:UDP-glycosyltransferase n=1 Tax=Coptis chinensis TaxID=261450 RepID=A0A835I921_9MAGN|nr:hypothetical protein IFM89_005490 [Coptis chinensis]
MHFTQPVADSLQPPNICLRTSSAICFVAFAAFPVLRQNGYIPVRESELDAQVPELPPLKVKDLPVIKNQNSGDHSCISWLNTQAPSDVVYISFGSIAAISEAQLVEIALGVANSEQSFLWVIRSGLVIGSCRSDEDNNFTKRFPQKFSEMMMSGRGGIVKWAPQQEVLAHPGVGGFWTHSGWNSTLESISEGVPMLCWPCFGEQMVNARYVSQVWRIGLQLENGLERGETERSLRRLMVQEENNKDREEMDRWW